MIRFNVRVSPLKNISVKIVNMVSERNSWITLSCQRLNGPPLLINPILLAGTMKLYSISAIPQLNNITNGNDNLLNQVSDCKRK